MHKFKLLILILITLTISVFGGNNIVIKSGHSHPVQTFARNGKLLFSSDNSGILMVWNTENGSLIKKLQVSYLMVKDLAVNAAGTHVAVVETDTISSFKLSVWDLKEDKKLFSHGMDELPLFIQFSPGGNYIIYSKTDWNGLRFLDAYKGFEVPLMFDDYGIVSSIYITASEKTLLFYSPSGTIQYWNLTSGEIKTSPIRTRKDLSSISMTEDGAFMAASDSTNLYLISLQTGKTLSTQKLSGILASTIINETRNLVILRKIDTKYEISMWKIAASQGRGTLTKIKSFEIPYTILPAAGFTLIDRTTFLSGSQGKIISMNIYTGKSNIFSDNIMADISDLDTISGKMLIATDRNLISLSSRLFIDGSEPVSKSDINTRSYKNPFLEATGVTTNNRNFFIYPMDVSKGELKKLNYGQFETLADSFSAPIVSAEFSNGNFITLEKDGTCQIIDAFTGESVFSYTSFGINSLESVSGENLIAGRNRTAFLQSPLLHINKYSEEIVLIEESNILIFKMDYDSITRTLYTIGFEERRSGLMTVLKAHSGQTWELTETILTYPGEDQAGSFVVDSSKSRIYLSIGNSGLVMYGWDGFTDMEDSGHIPEKLYVYNDLLISLNTDSSLSIWNTVNGNHILDFYLLRNGKWIAISRAGEIILSDADLNNLIY